MTSKTESTRCLVETLETRRLLAALDPSFGEDGIASLGVAIPRDTRVLNAIDAGDGRSLLSLEVENVPSGVLVMLDAAGNRDMTFGVGGEVVLQNGDPIRDVFANIDGSFEALQLSDASFDRITLSHTGDLLTTESFDLSTLGREIIRTHDGRYVQVNWRSLTALDEDGQLDTSFGNEGVVDLPKNPHSVVSDFIAAAVAEDAQGRLLVVGSREHHITMDDFPQVLRYLPDGTLDATFGVNGEAAVASGHEVAGLVDVEIDDAGRLLFVGTEVVEPPSDDHDPDWQQVFVAALDADGNPLDILTGESRRVVASSRSWNPSPHPPQLEIAEDGTLIVSHRPADGSPPQVHSVATGFAPVGGDGVDLTEAASGLVTSESPLPLFRDGDGRVVFANSGQTDAEVPLIDLVVTRLDADLVLDASFGSAGMTTQTASIEVDSSYHDGVQTADGGISVIGSLIWPVIGGIPVGRLTPDGQPDAAFGSDGLELVGFDGKSGGMAAHPDGGFVIAGTVDNPDRYGDVLIVRRYLPDGSIDPNFDFDARDHAYLGWDRHDSASHVLIAGDGAVYVMANFRSCCSGSPVMVRLLPDGTPDPSYGTNGVVEIYRPSSWGYQSALLQTDGSIYLSGARRVEPFGQMITRLLPDGSRDLSFGTNGFVALEHTGNVHGELIPDGPDHFLVVGAGPQERPDHSYTENRIHVGRFQLNGTPDTSFGDGTVPGFTHIPANEDDVIHGVVRMPDGTLFGVGRAGSDGDDALTLRLNAQGVFDSSLAPAPLQAFDLGGADESLADPRLDADGNVLAKGLRRPFDAASEWVAAKFDLMPPTVSDISFSWAGGQRIELGFSEAVDLVPSLSLPFELRNADGEPVDIGWSVRRLSPTRLAFEAWVPLADGTYAFQLVPGAAEDGAGNASLGSSLQHIGVLTGDANGDGAVDLGDFGILRSEFGKTGPDLRADFDGDRKVDLADFGLLRARFGSMLTTGGQSLFATDADEKRQL